MSYPLWGTRLPDPGYPLSHSHSHALGTFSLGISSINHPNEARELHRASMLRTTAYTPRLTNRYPLPRYPSAPLPLYPLPFLALPFECFQCINFRFLWHLSGHSQRQPRACSSSTSVSCSCSCSFPIHPLIDGCQNMRALISAHLISSSSLMAIT